MKWREIDNRSRLRGLLRPKFMRTESERVTKWLNPAFESHWPDRLDKVDSVRCFRLDSPFNLHQLVYENETRNGIRYRVETEGLTRTYPTEKFLNDIEKMLDANVPDELKELTFQDIGDSDPSLILGTMDRTPAAAGVSALLSFAVPVYRKDMAEFKDRLIEFTRRSYVHGYDLSSIEEMNHSDREDVAVLVVQFEARYSRDNKPKLDDVLYHVSPMRYLPKIRKNGLVPRSKSDEFKYNDRIYLFNGCPMERILEYGRYKARDINDRGFCLFSIQTEKLKSLDTYKNGNLPLYVDWSFDSQAVFTYNNIPLSVIDDTCTMYYLDGRRSEKFNFKQQKMVNI